MDQRTLSLLLNTLCFSAGATAVSLALGTLLAALLARTDLPGRRVGLLLLVVMLFVPTYLHAAAWRAGFGVQGWLTRALGLPLWLDGTTGAVWVQAAASVPWVVLIVAAGLRLVEPELEEQALLDGSPRQVFLRVTLRGALPAVGIAAIWVAVLAAADMTVPSLFIVRTYAEELYTQTALGPEVGQAPLGVLPGVVLSAALVVAVAWLLGRLARARRPATLRRRRVFRLGGWKVPLAVLATGLVVLLVGVPAANLGYKAGVVVERVGDEWVRSWSPWKCLATAAASPVQYRREIGWSLLIGAASATAAVALGTLMAWPLRQAARPRGALWILLLLLAGLGLAVPGPALGIAIIRLLNRPGCPWLLYLYDDTIFAPWLALTLRAMPLAWLVLWHAIRSLPPAMLDAAAVDGAGSLRQLGSVALPNRRPALAMAWIVAFAVALGELGASVLVVPPGVTTLSVRIFDLLHSGAEDPVAGISLALLAVFAALGGLAWLAAARWSGRAPEQSRS